MVGRGVRVSVRVIPRSSKNAVQWERGALKVRLTAAPVEGAANEALIALLAERLRLPKRNVSIVQGATSRLRGQQLPGGLRPFLVAPGPVLAPVPNGVLDDAIQPAPEAGLGPIECLQPAQQGGKQPGHALEHAPVEQDRTERRDHQHKRQDLEAEDEGCSGPSIPARPA